MKVVSEFTQLSFDSTLATVFDEMLTMHRLCGELLELSMDGLESHDLTLSNTAIAGFEEIEHLDAHVTELATDALTQFAPRGGDLRQLVSAMRIANSLRHAASQGVCIARKARKLIAPADPDTCHALRSMFHLGASLMRTSIAAFKSGEDQALATLLEDRDAQVDRTGHRIVDELLFRMCAQPEGISDFLNLLAIARSLERLGDDAKIIAEDVIHAAEIPRRL